MHIDSRGKKNKCSEYLLHPWPRDICPDRGSASGLPIRPLIRKKGDHSFLGSEDQVRWLKEHVICHQLSTDSENGFNISCKCMFSLYYYFIDKYFIPLKRCMSISLNKEAQLFLKRNVTYQADMCWTLIK